VSEFCSGIDERTLIRIRSIFLQVGPVVVSSLRFDPSFHPRLMLPSAHRHPSSYPFRASKTCSPVLNGCPFPQQMHVCSMDARFLDECTFFQPMHVSSADACFSPNARFFKGCTFSQSMHAFQGMHVFPVNARFSRDARFPSQCTLFKGCTFSQSMHAFSTEARFLQTDLLVAAAKTGKVINIKKGQFCSPAVSSRPLLRSL
jgi:hypothetical protein